MTQTSLTSKVVEVVDKMSFFQKRTVWLVSDFLAFILASIATRAIFYGLFQEGLSLYLLHILLGFIFYNLISSLLNLRTRINRYALMSDISLLFVIVIIANILSGTICSFIIEQFPIRYAVVMSGLSAILVVGLRLIWQTIYFKRFGNRYVNENSEIENIVLIGAGDGGSLYMSSQRRHLGKENVVAIFDEDASKVGLNLGGVKVVGGLEKLPEVTEEFGVSKAVIAIPSLKPEKYEEILQKCNELDIKVYNMPPVEEVLLGIHNDNNQVREINIADLLGRKEIELNEERLRNEIEGKKILITGAGGSIGSEIVRQISKFNPAKLLLLGHGENSIYLIYHEVNIGNRMTQYVPIIADIQDYDRIYKIFKKEKPDIVYHAAAHKHVPLMESNPVEAYKNNIIGTYNVAKAVDKAGVPKMVMISTDKAVKPPNIMGATKRVAELIITGMNEKSNSTYCAVRFGNVLGSRGSVVPAFKKQILAGGPVQVTDFRMIRYFMTIPEASRLVVYAGAFAEGGEVFILDMGEPVKILDLAKKMILLMGYTVSEIGIEEVGIRPGEKLYEELLTNSELVENQLNDQIFIGRVASIPLEETLQFVESLKKYIEQPRELKEKIITFANESAE
ncbi:polysaccharide biosynthesis protein [Facklamia sp. DSM 111018]|uniref:Polysaccharide biosynthesis protein n=1 Tax=Facklamia lactis TaxID=2749967 RepID=A0ABS0LQV7_9LACT|nr:nucleoside-diphosphate sugar epimerase/dehydratase [Facklamia lactis]MBG9980731.1 polysaccharide biosynthesis protein [Facklamia lactis]MBG9986545.1 polysaccharide biosynthesis protein [Facklamia lactis]